MIGSLSLVEEPEAPMWTCKGHSILLDPRFSVGCNLTNVDDQSVEGEMSIVRK